jgi:hypothetical protein
VTWSSTGSVASFPTEKPPLLNAAGTTNYGALTPSTLLAFRKDPDAGIVYVTGWWDANGINSGSIFAGAYRLPVAFRPLQPYALLLRSQASGFTAVSQPVQIGTDGNVVRTVDSGSGNNNYMLNGFYYTNV